MEDQRETAEHFQPRQIKRETDTDGPRQDFVIIDVISELDRIERFNSAGINENSADNQIHNSPDEFHDSEQTSNIQRPTPNWLIKTRSTLASFLRLQPLFPATLKDEHVWQLRFLAQAAGNFATGVAAQTAAIDDNLFLWRPHRQKLRQQFIPAVFIQRNSSGNMITSKFGIRPRIDPNCIVAPGTRLRRGDHFRGWNRRLP